MEINFEEQSYETLYYLAQQTNNVLQETAQSVKEFEELTKLIRDSVPGMQYHLSVLKDLLSGEAKDSFKYIENLFIQTQEISLKSITNLAGKMNLRFAELDEIIQILKSKEN